MLRRRRHRAAIEGFVDQRRDARAAAAKMNAEMGTPSGASHFGEMLGDCRAGTV